MLEHRAVLWTPVALGFSATLAAGLATLVWLIQLTRMDVPREVFQITRARIIAPFIMAFVTPIAVLSWIPWILGGFSFFIVSEPALFFGFSGVYIIAMSFWFPICAMIIRHTKNRHIIRVGLFCLMYFSAYSLIMIIWGYQEFRI
ncbi:hypothetical protein [Aestuariibius sp. HNIBRBA575]|uniref:hypothetical protein n=1 Tax=Aestuariibius sp. HNIBRBA575 TaxID=3233343 RepID=UPI0034A54993